MKNYLQLILSWFASAFFCLPSIAQAPVNDECSGAIAVLTTPFGTSCSSPTAASTVNATASAPAPSCASTLIADDDIWYSFTANSSSAIIRVSNAVQVPSGIANISMEIYSGSCGTLTSVTCVNNFAGGSGHRIVDGLTAGNTYYLRFWSVSTINDATFNFCIQQVPAPPANDECANATAITTQPFSTTCAVSIAANTTGATQSAFNPSCAGLDNNDDIWYSFTANSSSIILRFNNGVETIDGGFGSLGYALYNTSCPSAASTFSCNNNIGFGSGLKIIDGLTIGNTYYLRLFSQSINNYLSFNFCVQDVPAPPANDECVNAIPITTQPFGTTCAASVSANTTGATPSSFNPTCASTDNNDDIWYSFTANSASVILRFSNGVQTTTGGFGSLGYALYQSTCPGSGTTFSCNSNIGFGNGYKIIDGLTIGNTYYLRLFSQNPNNYMSYDFCVQDVPAPPVNDECVNAIPITTQPFGTTCAASVSANTTGATPSSFNPTCASTDNNDDIWYSFTANSASVILRFSNGVQTTTGGFGSLAYALYQSTCPGSATTFSCSSNIGFSNGYKIIDGLTIGNTYYLRLFSQNPNNYMSFDFCVQDVPAPPVNDECVNAIPITTQPFGTTCAASVSANTTGATSSSFNPSCVSTDNNDDIWYSFTANSASIILRFSNGVQTTTGAIASLGYALYLSPCPASTASFSCSSDIGFGNGYKIIDGLTIGNTYYLRLFSQNANNYMSFDFCVQDVPAPPANDECVNAIPVPLTLPGTLCVSTITANTTGSTLSFNSPNCLSAGNNNDDTWYSFIASANTAILRYSNCFETTTANGANIGYALYNACPANSTSLACSNGFGFVSGFVTLSGLTPGNTYFLRLFGSNANNYVSFNFCIQTPLINDECINAIDIPVSNGFCNTPVVASLNGATSSAGFGTPSCRIGGLTRDVWFKTTIPATGNLIIQTSAIKLSGSDLVMSAYTGVCGSLTEIACDDNGNPETAPSANHSRIILTGRIPGEVITLRVTAGFTGSEEQFAICAWDETASVLPAVSTGGNCISGIARTIDSTQGNIFMWVPVFDNTGNIIAEFYSNGIDLGLVSPTLFVNSGPVRQFGTRFYLDRNLSIQSSTTLTNPVKLRIYLRQSELTALQGVDPTVSGITQIKITKTNTGCQSAYSGTPVVINQESNAGYGPDHYLQFSSPGFSSFYFDGLTGVLPLKFLHFTVSRKQTTVSINWSVVIDSSVNKFEIEKSENAIQFNTIASLNRDEFRSNRNGEWSYSYLEQSPGNSIYYYRIKLINAQGRIVYSRVEKIGPTDNPDPELTLYPNPVRREMTIGFTGTPNDLVTISIMDITGKELMQLENIRLTGKITLDVGELKNGVYVLRIIKRGKSYWRRFVK